MLQYGNIVLTTRIADRVKISATTGTKIDEKINEHISIVSITTIVIIKIWSKLTISRVTTTAPEAKTKTST